MPLYIYQHPKTEETIEIFQGMNDTHEYTDSEGTQWRRVFLSPNANFDTDVDPFSKSDYLKATENKRGTIGDMMDYSKELSQRRAEKSGTDPVKEKFLKVYESKNVKVEYD